MQQRFNPATPPLAMLALAGINDERHDGVDGQKDAEGFGQINGPIAGGKKLSEGEDENCEMKKKKRIRQIGNHLAGHPRAIIIVIGQQPETGFQPATLLPRLDQGDVEGGEPWPHGAQRFGKSVALRQAFEQPFQRLPVRTGRRTAL